jgi:16S rRNA (cytosine967-C5)-methyltransferase
LEKLDTSLNEQVEARLDDKLMRLKENYGFVPGDVFLFKNFLSDVIEPEKFCRSFLIQPLVFLRVRPGNEAVKEKLQQSNIQFQIINEQCLATEPATKLSEVLEINKEVVIQDLSSQQVLRSLMQYADKSQTKKAWDCCAASGGKSILLKDSFPDIQLTVSDIRESILINLTKRLQQAGIKVYKKILVDLSKSSINEQERFDLIICDAPCSGSGTWSRTPEQLYFFKKEKIDEYASLQKKIVANAVKNLKSGGFFLYITCSVFQAENEGVVKFIEENAKLKLVYMEYIKGYHKRADTLFTALFTL